MDDKGAMEDAGVLPLILEEQPIKRNSGETSIDGSKKLLADNKKYTVKHPLLSPVFIQ